MSDQSNDRESLPTVPRTIRFPDGEWERIEDAAARLSDDLHITVSPTEFVRSAVRKRLEEILGTAAAA